MRIEWICIPKLKQLKWRISPMTTLLTRIYVKAQILREDYGQDLIEYALVVALIAFAATAGMGSVATAINTAFGNIGNKLTTYIP
jgi:pilus assembly protein Flp/PilA